MRQRDASTLVVAAYDPIMGSHIGIPEILAIWGLAILVFKPRWKTFIEAGPRSWLFAAVCGIGWSVAVVALFVVVAARLCFVRGMSPIGLQDLRRAC